MQARRRNQLLVVDPIDGSHNALRGMPFATVCLALGPGDLGGIEKGVVRDLSNGVTYWAARGRGAFRDGHRLRTRAVVPPFGAVLREPRPALHARTPSSSPSTGARIRSAGLRLARDARWSRRARPTPTSSRTTRRPATSGSPTSPPRYRILLEAGGGMTDVDGPHRRGDPPRPRRAHERVRVRATPRSPKSRSTARTGEGRDLGEPPQAARPRARPAGARAPRSKAEVVLADETQALLGIDLPDDAARTARRRCRRRHRRRRDVPHTLQRSPVPLLPINAGTVGFLAEVDGADRDGVRLRPRPSPRRTLLRRGADEARVRGRRREPPRRDERGRRPHVPGGEDAAVRAHAGRPARRSAPGRRAHRRDTDRLDLLLALRARADPRPGRSKGSSSRRSPRSRRRSARSSPTR